MIACRSALISAAACLLALLPAPAQATEVVFPDPNLEQAILAKIGKDQPPITTDDLVGLTELDATERGICKLEGLRACTHLTTLKLGENRISDVLPLARLSQLTKLELHKNYLTDISPLAQLTNLIDLDLHRNFITDVNAIEKLTKLEKLDLSENCIRNIEPLRDLVHLNELRLYRNWVRDVNALGANPGIDTGDIVDVNNNLLTADTYLKDVKELESEERLGYRICEPYDPNKGDPHVLDFPIYWDQSAEDPSVEYNKFLPKKNEREHQSWACEDVAYAMIIRYHSMQQDLTSHGSYWYWRHDANQVDSDPNDPNDRMIADYDEEIEWNDMLPAVRGLGLDDPRVDCVAKFVEKLLIAARRDWKNDPTGTNRQIKGRPTEDRVCRYFGVDMTYFHRRDIDAWFREQGASWADPPKLYELIVSEIDAGRPVEQFGGGHGRVITGYCWLGDHWGFSMHPGRPYNKTWKRYDPSQFYRLVPNDTAPLKRDELPTGIISWGIKPFSHPSQAPTYNKIADLNSSVTNRYRLAISWNGKEYGALVPTGESGKRSVTFQSISADGRRRGPSVELSPQAGDAPRPALVWGTGCWVAAWRTDNGVVIKRLGRDGQTLDEFGLHLEKNTRSPAIVYGENEYLVVFEGPHINWGPSPCNSRMSCGILSADGNLNALRNAQGLGCGQRPGVAWTGQEYVVTWQDDKLLHLARIEHNTGNKLSSRSLPLEFACTKPTVACSGKNIGLAWVSQEIAGQHAVYFCLATTDGEFLPESKIIVDDRGEVRQVELSHMGSNYYLSYNSCCPWEGFLATISDDGQIVESRRLFTNPKLLGHAKGNSCINVLETRFFGKVELHGDNNGEVEYDVTELESCLVPIAIDPDTADINVDESVDLRDFALLARNYGKSGRQLTGDIDDDGFVTPWDLSRLCQNWLGTYSPNEN